MLVSSSAESCTTSEGFGPCLLLKYVSFSDVVVGDRS